MNQVNSLTFAAYSCRLEAAKALRLHAAVPCDLLPESALYAVCRFLRSSATLRRELVRESYRLRLATGKGRKSRRRSFVAPAALLELPGSWAMVRLTVTARGVEVEEVFLSDHYPNTRPKRRCSASHYRRKDLDPTAPGR